MKRYMRKTATWLAVLMTVLNVWQPVYATEPSEVEILQENNSENTGVTVSTTSDFLSALSSGETLITVVGQITVGDEADESGKMLPVEIPGNVTIQGTSDAEVVCRCPIQLSGDNVILRNLRIVFISTNALGSVPHREIFLAGHSLTLDNVDTYQEGGDNIIGNLGGNEEELLPTVYGGAFEGTQTLGTNASLTIQNANEKTMFQAIYMGHDEGTDSKVAYNGKATVSIGPKAVVRDGIYVNQNETSEIAISGNGNLSNVSFYGNDSTLLDVKVTNVNRASIDGIGTIVLDNNAYFQLVSGEAKHVTIENGACLDCNEMTDVFFSGDLIGGSYDTQMQTDSRGILVLNQFGTLSIEGKVTGTTLLHTGDKNFPGEYEDGKTYITVDDTTSSSSGFVMPESKAEYYELIYADGAWSVISLYDGTIPLVGSVEILSAPQSVDVSKVISTGLNPSAQAPYCEVVWKDENGTAYTAEEVQEYQFYLSDMIIGIRTDYWTSDSADEQTDWANGIWFVLPEEPDGKYYFYSENEDYIKTGEYTYLFCSEYFDSLNTVADVKQQLEGKVVARLDVTFYDSTEGGNPGTDEDPNPGDSPESPSQEPVHTHGPVTQQITPARPGTDGLVRNVCSICGTVIQTEVIAAPKSMKLSKGSYTYTGKACKPSVTLTDKRGRVIGSQCYKVSYVNHKKVGKATVTVTLTGNYSGTMKKTFTITPKKSSVTKLSAKKKAFVVKWKKVSTQIDGYQIQYSTNKNFTKKKTKTVTVKNKKSTSKTIKKLKAKKTYYVRIRTYKTVSIDGKSKKIYSGWSKVKKIKTKR